MKEYFKYSFKHDRNCFGYSLGCFFNMKETEFDKFAEEYSSLHQQSIRFSGEAPSYFSEYKIRDTANILTEEERNGSIDIIDFGSGVGSSVPFIHKYFPQGNLTCLDVSSKSLDLAKKRFPNQANFCSFDGDVIPFNDNSFDLVFSACVFHHIDHDEHDSLIKEIHRVLRSGGLLVIFEHNPFNPFTRHAVNICPFDENAVLLKASQLVKVFRKAGFSEISRKYRVFIPGFLRGLRWLENFIGWLPLGAQYYVAARKK